MSKRLRCDDLAAVLNASRSDPAECLSPADLLSASGGARGSVTDLAVRLTHTLSPPLLSLHTSADAASVGQSIPRHPVSLSPTATQSPTLGHDARPAGASRSSSRRTRVSRAAAAAAAAALRAGAAAAAAAAARPTSSAVSAARQHHAGDRSRHLSPQARQAPETDSQCGPDRGRRGGGGGGGGGN